MAPRIKPRVTDRTPTSTRLRQLREALDPVPGQEEIAARVGEGQMWVSRRERGKPEPSVEDAIRIAEALGYAADFLILDRKHAELLAMMGEASPEATTYALRLLALFPQLDQTGLVAVEGLIGALEGQTAKATAS